MFSPYEKVYRVKQKKEWGVCSKCFSSAISNNFHALCVGCMFEQTHGITQKEHAKKLKAKNDLAARERAKLKTIVPSVPKTKIPFFSEKGAKKAKEIHAAKQKNVDAAIENDSLFCVNCGINHWTNSHIIAVSQRGDLAADPKNLSFLCIPCHSTWGEGKIEDKIKMKGFLKDAKYIHDNDDTRFQKLLFSILDYYTKSKDKFAGQILRSMERF